MTLRRICLAVLLASCSPAAAPATTPPAPGASRTDVPRSAFPSGEEGRLAWVRACFPDSSMGLLLLPDLPYISSPPTKQWWESTPVDTSEVRFASGGGGTEYRSKDPAAPQVSTVLFPIRAERWRVDGRMADARYRQAVECAYTGLAAR